MCTSVQGLPDSPMLLCAQCAYRSTVRILTVSFSSRRTKQQAGTSAYRCMTLLWHLCMTVVMLVPRVPAQVHGQLQGAPWTARNCHQVCLALARSRMASIGVRMWLSTCVVVWRDRYAGAGSRYTTKRVAGTCVLQLTIFPCACRRSWRPSRRAPGPLHHSPVDC